MKHDEYWYRESYTPTRAVYVLVRSLFAFDLVTKLQSIHITQPCNYYNLSLPKPLESHQITYFENIKTCYLFGGEAYNGPHTSSSAIYKWNRSHENSWFELLNESTTPSSRFTAYTNNAVIIGDKAYFVGIDDGLVDGNIYIFDFLTDSFLNTTNLSKPLYLVHGGCVATNQTHIFMVGGLTHNHLQIYDINADLWKSEDINISSINMLNAYYGQFCEMKDDLLFVFGGFGHSSLGAFNVNDYFVYESNIQKSTHLGTKNGSTYAGATAYYSSDILIIGGYDFVDNHVSSNILAFNVSNRQFRDTFSVIDAVWYFPTLILDHQLYIFGGMNGTHRPISLVQICSSSFPTQNKIYVYITVIVSGVTCIAILCTVLICIKRRRCNHRFESMESLLQMNAK